MPLDGAVTNGRSTEDRDDALLVVSCDCHVGPPIEDYIPFADPADAETYETWVRDIRGNDATRWSVVNAAGLDRSIFPDEHLERMRIAGETPGLADPDQRIRDMDADGVAAEVVFHGGQNGQPLPFNVGCPDDLRTKGIRIYNRWLAEFLSVEPDRHIGVAQLPYWDLEATIAEVRWAREHGLKAVNLPAPRRDLMLYTNPTWDALWAVCDELDLPLVTHTGGGDMPAYEGVGQIAMHMCETGFYSRRTLWHLILGGVFERFPQVKFVLTEVGSEWLTEDLRTMDSSWHAVQARRLREEVPHPPSFYWERNCYIGNSFMSRDELRLTLDHGIEDRVMWGSDYPHEEGTWPNTRAALRWTFADASAPVLRQILGDTALGVYDLDADRLAEVARRIGPTVDEILTPLPALPDGHLGMAFREHGRWS